jgi:hypothetical protein
MTPEQQIKYLEIELTQVKREATRLRKTLHENSRHARRINRAYQDALLLVTFRVAGIIPSRRFAGLHEISQNRYENALGLLRMARIIQRERHWIMIDAATAEGRLEKARQNAIEYPESFFCRMNSHHTQG